MKILLINNEGVKDISELVTGITWSGDIRQAARKLEISVAVSPHDYYLPKIYIGLGNMLKLTTDEGKELFRGYVFFKEKSHQSSEMKIVAYDGLIYLMKSNVSYNFRNMTAEAITKKVCSDLGISVGYLASTNITQSFIAMGKKAYDVIMTAYTNVSKQNGKKYMTLMKEGKLAVIEKGAAIVSYILDNDTNLINTTYSESIENMINKVIITDENGNKVGEIINDDWIKSFGILQAVYKKERDKDAKTVASNMLKGIDRKATVEALGNINCITGNAVMIKESYTGLTGLFYIDNDVHTFKDGHHTMKLAVNFLNIMDEKEVQEKLKKSSNIKDYLDW